MDKIRAAWVEVDKKTAAENFESIKQYVKKENENTKICAVVKANCYGMGAIEMSKMYAELGAHMLATAIIDEALEIREEIKNIGILVLGYTYNGFYEDAIKNDISLTVYTYEQAKELDEVAQRLGKKAKIHIKIDTGMNRLGFCAIPENADVIEKIYKMKNIFIEGIYTHFATADEEDKTFSHIQAEKFIDFLKLLDKKNIQISLKHMSSSAGAIDLPEYDMDMIRAGIVLLGFYPSEHIDKTRLVVKPCMSLKSRVVNLKKVPKNSGISYGHTYKTEKEEIIGTVPLGYADGFSRSYSNNFYVSVKGTKCPVRGLVCMDQFMIDLSDVDNPQIGDEVTIYGIGNDCAMTMEDAAKVRNTITNEVAATLSYRLPRRYL